MSRPLCQVTGPILSRRAERDRIDIRSVFRNNIPEFEKRNIHTDLSQAAESSGSRPTNGQ
jgi:hypothetical protein